MMKILITGVNGFIGKALKSALSERYDVTTVARRDIDLTHSFSVSNFFQTRRSFDVVIHCAVVGGSRLKIDSWDVMDQNLLMYYNLLQNRRHYTKLIHFGSGAETYMPSEPYGYSKRVIAKSILNQSQFYNIKIFGLFDETELSTRFIKANLTRYINKEPMQIHKDNVMDFFYMRDLIKVVEYYINEEEPPKEFDCTYGTENLISLKNLADMINNLDTHKVRIHIQNKGLDTYTSQYRTVLPIKLIGLEKGIKEVYELTNKKTVL